MAETVKQELGNGWILEVDLGERCLVRVVDSDGHTLSELEYPDKFWRKKRKQTELRNQILETANMYQRDYEELPEIILKDLDSGDLDVDGKWLQEIINVVRRDAPTTKGKKKKSKSKKESLPDLKKEDIKGQARELLENPGLLHEIEKKLTQGFVLNDTYMFVLGEGRNKLFTYLVFLSAGTKYPQMEWISGDPGTGKSNTATTCARLFPAGWVKERGYFTGAALRYSEGDYKVLYIKEFRAEEQDFRLTSTEDQGFTVEIAKRDEETGEMTTEVHEVPARTFITTSAEDLPSDQLVRRMWLVSANESKALTKKVNKRVAKYAEGEIEPASMEEIEVLRKLPTFLDDKPVKIPYATELLKLEDWDRTNYKRFLDLVRLIALLYQHQRGVVDGEIVADLQDIYMAHRISREILEETLGSLPSRLKSAKNVVQEVGEATVKDVARALEKSQSTVRSYLNDLVNIGWLYKEKDGRKNIYTPAKEQHKLSDFESGSFDWSECEEKVVDVLGGTHRTNDDPQGVCIDPITGEEVNIYDYDYEEDYNNKEGGSEKRVYTPHRESSVRQVGSEGKEEPSEEFEEEEIADEESEDKKQSEMPRVPISDVKDELVDILNEEPPTPQELQHEFDPDELVTVNELLVRWRSEGQVYIDSEGRWRLNK